jgi:hypothetical protein
MAAIGEISVFRRFSAHPVWQARCTSLPRRQETSKEATLRVLRGLLALLTCLAFSGCVLRGPEIELKPPVEIKAEPEGRFCPPGQAKKGNC